MNLKEDKFGYVEVPSDAETLRSEIRKSNPITNGTVIYYTKKFSGDSNIYSFSAVYHGGFWYTTAQRSVRVGHRAFMEEIASPEVTSVYTLRLDEKVK